MHYMARPLDKGGGKVRPIVLGELLVKLALGCLVDVHRNALDSLFTGREDGGEPDAPRGGLFLQLGLTQCDGVSQMLEHARFLASANPHRALIALDVKNAFGEMSRAWRRKSVSQDVPTMERGLAQLWSRDHVLHVERTPGEWEPTVVADGLWQGSCEATAVYCVGFRRALVRLFEETTARGIRIDLLLYIDDACLSVSPDDLEVVWPLLQECLACAGLRLVPEKCKAFVPGATETDPRITRHLEQLLDGLPLLGTALNGELESFLGPFSLSIQPARERLERATRLLAQIRDMSREVLESSVLQSAWCLVSLCAAHSLDFDMRVHNPGDLLPLTSVLSTELADTVSHLLGLARALNQQTRSQLFLAIDQGGFGLPDFSAVVPAARLAACLQVRAVVSSRLRSVGWSSHAVDAFLPCDAALEAQDLLRGLGVVLDSAGVPQRAPLSEGNSELDLLVPPAPLKGLFSRTLA